MNFRRLALAAAICSGLSATTAFAGNQTPNGQGAAGGNQTSSDRPPQTRPPQPIPSPVPPAPVGGATGQTSGDDDLILLGTNNGAPGGTTDGTGGSINDPGATDSGTDDGTGSSGTPLTAGGAALLDGSNHPIGRIQFQTGGAKGAMLVAAVKFKLPNADLGWITKDDVKDSTLTAIFTHSDGTDFASCDFDLTNVRLNKRRNVGIAQFKLDNRVKGGAVKERLGACDTDLSTADYEAGIPAFEEGDTVTLTLDTSDVDAGTGEIK